MIPKAHVEAVLEDVSRKLQLLLDGHATLIKRFDAVDFRLDTLVSRLDKIILRLDKIGGG